MRKLRVRKVRELAHSWVVDLGYEPKQSGSRPRVLSNRALLLSTEDFPCIILFSLPRILLSQNNDIHYSQRAPGFRYMADPVQSTDLCHSILTALHDILGL